MTVTVLTHSVVSLYRHRYVFSHKMEEAWCLLGYRRDWESYRIQIFKYIASMVMLCVVSNSPSIVPLLKLLKEQVKASQKDTLIPKIDNVIENPTDLEPCYSLLSSLADSEQHYYSLFVSLYTLLVKFIVNPDNSLREDELPETMLINLLNDLAISNVSALSAYEKKPITQVISVITSTMTNSVNLNEKVSIARRENAQAAMFLGRRFKQIHDASTLTHAEEQDFWDDSTGIKLSLSKRCTTLLSIKNILPKFGLPKLSHLETDVEVDLLSDGIDSDNDNDLSLSFDVEDVEDKVEVESSASALPMSVQRLDVRSIPVVEIRKRLEALGKSTAGKKADLKSRLASTEGYYDSTPRPKVGFKRRAIEMSPDESE